MGSEIIKYVKYLVVLLYNPSHTHTHSDSRDLLPVLLCGDLNSTPNSPLLKFLLDSNLDYSNLSALVIAGYFEDRGRKRIIPAPLLPAEMNIGLDCTYKRLENDNDVIVIEDDTDVIVIEDDTADEKVTGDTVDRGTKRRAEMVSRNGSKNAKQAGAQHSEFTSTDSERKSTRTTRSIRGAKGKGRMTYSGINLSDIPSLLGSSLSATKRGRGEDSSPVDDLRVPSRSSSIGDSVLGDGEGTGREMTSGRSSEVGCQSRASCAEDSAGESLESSTNSVAKNTAPSGSIGGKTDGAGGPRGGGRTKHVPKSSGPQNSVLTHPFKLIPAYPISKTQPSTITTYHQNAFETVDYIFFSPISCRTNGTGRKNLTGFNLLKRKVLPSTHTLLDLGPQPHQFLSSDHLLLLATFQFSW